MHERGDLKFFAAFTRISKGKVIVKSGSKMAFVFSYAMRERERER